MVKCFVIPLLTISLYLTTGCRKSINTEVYFDKKIIDLHKIDLLEPAVAQFEIKNIGAYPLIITNVVTDCHCTNVTWPKKPIPPGGIARISVEYDKHKPGFFQRNVTVMCNTKNSPVLFTFQGIVTK